MSLLGAFGLMVRRGNRCPLRGPVSFFDGLAASVTILWTTALAFVTFSTLVWLLGVGAKP
jgi:hypothetical protein